MKLIIEPTDQAMSESAMHIVLGAMMQDKRVNVSLTSGESPKTLYKLMAPMVRDRPQFDDVHYYVFDDCPVEGEEHGLVWDDMQRLFYEPANIPVERVHSITPSNWETYDREIRDAGGLDVMVIGLGWDGHFCTNCPRVTPLDSYSYRIARSEINAQNPTYPERPGRPFSYTMGPRSLMRAKHLVMIVNGKHKAEALKRVLDEPISPEVPSTVLKLHPNFTLIADADAASLIDPAEYPEHRI